MRIRPYISSLDFDAIRPWIADERTHAMWCAGRFPYPLEKESFEAALRDMAARYGDSPFVATADDGKPLGFFCYARNAQTSEGFFKFVLVDSALRGRGYGKEMLALALRNAFEITKADAAGLCVFAENAAAVRCYRNMGFTETGRTAHAFVFRGEAWSRIRMTIQKERFLQYSEEKKEEPYMLTTISSRELTVVISSLGAEIQSIRDRQGVEYMWQGDPKFWANRAPILFPVAGGLREDRYIWQGKSYPMSKHGIVRNVEWEAEEAEGSRAVFKISRQTEGFPFAYDLRAIFTVEQNRLTVEYAVTNRDRGPFCFSIGAHEAYATPGGIQDYEIVFDEEENLLHSPLNGNLNEHTAQVIAEHTRVLPLSYDYFQVDALVFRSLKSKGVTLRGKTNGRKLRVDFPEHPILMFWDKPGAEYICIEPWCNGPDFVDAPYEIDRKFGFLRIQPGETIARRHVITVG